VNVLPSATARALLAGFRALELDAEAIQAAAGIAPEALVPVDAAISLESFGQLWAEAFRRAPREELVTEAGLAIPFGAFGAIDYLAASAPTVGTAFHALSAHFRQVAQGVSLEIVEAAGGGEVRLVNAPAFQYSNISDEFTIAVFVGRFRSRSLQPPFAAQEIRLTRPAPGHPTRHAALLGAPVVFGCGAAALRIGAQSWGAPLPTADPTLQAMLRQLAEHIGLGQAGDGELEVRVRSRLRLLLPDGRAEAREVARSLGLSSRTLERRLRAAGTTFRQVLERFREAEAERLVAAGRLPLGEVALRLGFSDQTAWNRAFRRWKGMSPREWMQRPQG
jgi:AraC-like DNA-binding protein